MNATLRIFFMAVLPTAALGQGCLHHHAVDPGASGLLECRTRSGETSCLESSRFDARGTLRHHVVERITPGDRCDLQVVEQTSFDAGGALLERVVEDVRCQVVDQRVIARYDLTHGVIEHRIQRDRDHDDQMDEDRTVRIAMAPHVRTQALTSGQARTAHLLESLSAQRGFVAGRSNQRIIATHGLH